MAAIDGRKKMIAIMVASAFTGAAIAAGVFTGVATHPTSAPVAPETATTTASPPPPAAKPAPARKRVAAKPRPAVNQVASAEAMPPVPQPPSFESCTNCGVVDAINSYTEKGPATGGGAVFGGLLGGILGHQVGQGRGKDLATVAGVVGGALAGNAMEQNTHKVTRYQVTVRMNDGSQQLFTLNAAPSLAAGDRVVIVNGAPVKQ